MSADSERLDERTDDSETPEWIRERTRAQRALVPDLGLGFEVAAIPAEVLRHVSDAWSQYSMPTRGYHVVSDTDAHLRTKIPGRPAAVLATIPGLNEWVLDAMHPVMETWAGRALLRSAAYGVRIYKRGAWLFDHVDRIRTHIVSATLAIASDLEHEWPLQVTLDDGTRRRVEIRPGTMVLYESARIEHGRPVPLCGRYYAGLFVHYRPEGWPFAPVTDEPVAQPST